VKQFGKAKESRGPPGKLKERIAKDGSSSRPTKDGKGKNTGEATLQYYFGFRMDRKREDYSLFLFQKT